MRRLRTSKIVGMTVNDPKNERLGDIQDIVLDDENGTVAYGVLSFGGWLGMGDKLFAVPWAALKLSADHETFVLNVPKERLKKAPGFDKQNWPDFDDQRWGVEVDSYYGRSHRSEFKVESGVGSHATELNQPVGAAEIPTTSKSKLEGSGRPNAISQSSYRSSRTDASS